MCQTVSGSDLVIGFVERENEFYGNPPIFQAILHIHFSHKFLLFATYTLCR